MKEYKVEIVVEKNLKKIRENCEKMLNEYTLLGWKPIFFKYIANFHLSIWIVFEKEK